MENFSSIDLNKKTLLKQQAYSKKGVIDEYCEMKRLTEITWKIMKGLPGSYSNKGLPKLSSM